VNARMHEFEKLFQANRAATDPKKYYSEKNLFEIFEGEGFR